MTERLRSLPLLLAAIATLLLAALGAMIVADPAQAAQCNPTCIPAPEEEAPEEVPPKPNPTPQPPPARTILVIGVGWDTGKLSTSATLEGANSAYIGYLNGHVNEWFAKAAAPAPFGEWRATSGGEYMIAPPRGLISSAEEHNAKCPATRETGELDPAGREFASDLAAQAEAKARQQGVDPDAYTVVLFQFNRTLTQCFSGLQSGRRTYLTDPLIAMHELGHYLGLGHARALRCYDAAHQPVPLSTDCKRLEYGDPYDAMGEAVPGLAFNAIHASKLGWMGGQYFDLSAGDYTVTHTIRPFTGSTRSDRALRLRDGGTTYWLEYRAPVGVDDPAFHGGAPPNVFGLLVHREPQAGQSELLDMTPGSVEDANESPDFFDAPLPVGQTWAVPDGEMRITLNSVSSAGASVTISSGKVTVPDFRGLTPSQAGAALEAAGLRSGGWSGTPDWFCNSIGTVVAQYPYAGARVLPGTAVSLTLGEEPPYCL